MNINIETIIEKYPHLETILRNTAIGLEVELITRGICPDCLEYQNDEGRCGCEQALLDWLSKLDDDDLEYYRKEDFAEEEEQQCA